MKPHEPEVQTTDPEGKESAPACPICGEVGREETGLHPMSPFIEGIKFNIVRCVGCGLFTTDPWPTPDMLHSIHDSGDYYSTIEASMSQVVERPLIDRLHSAVRALVIRQHFATGGAGFWGWLASLVARRRFGWAPRGLPKGGKLLDVGCGDGVFLLDVRDAGWDVSGLDISPTAVRNARRLGLNVDLGSVEDHPLEPGGYDVVRMWSVLEHVPRSDIALDAVLRLLKPGGWLILQVPDVSGFTPRLQGARWTGWHVPLHLVHFDRGTLERAIRKSGLMPVEFHSASVGTMIGRYPQFKNMIGRMAVFLMDQLFDLLGHGDSMIVFARKPFDGETINGV
jgi:SAM-dependent methyltransferase